MALKAVRATLIAFTFALGGGLAANTGALAQNQELAPEHIAIAREFIDTIDAQRIFEVTVLQAGVQTSRMITQRNPTMAQEQGDAINDAIGRTIAGYSDNKEDLLDQIARIYALRFTAEELTELNDFFNTEVGMKYVEQNAAISEEMQTVMTVFRRNLQTEFVTRVRADLRENGIEL